MNYNLINFIIYYQLIWKFSSNFLIYFFSPIISYLISGIFYYYNLGFLAGLSILSLTKEEIKQYTIMATLR